MELDESGVPIEHDLKKTPDGKKAKGKAVSRKEDDARSTVSRTSSVSSGHAPSLSSDSPGVDISGWYMHILYRVVEGDNA